MRMLQCAEHYSFCIEKLSVNGGDSHESHRSFLLLREFDFHTKQSERKEEKKRKKRQKRKKKTNLESQNRRINLSRTMFI